MLKRFISSKLESLVFLLLLIILWILILTLLIIFTLLEAKIKSQNIEYPQNPSINIGVICSLLKELPILFLLTPYFWITSAKVILTTYIISDLYIAIIFFEEISSILRSLPVYPFVELLNQVYKTNTESIFFIIPRENEMGMMSIISNK